MPWLDFECRKGPVRLFYETDGEGPGEPVVLVMGLGGRGRGFEGQIGAIAAHHPVVWFDNRGAGDTQAAPGRYTMGLFADDVRRLMDHLGWPRAHLAGASMGGMIAQEFALRFPERVISLSLLVTHAGGRRPRLPRPTGLRRFARVVGRKGGSRVTALEQLLFPDAYLAEVDREALRRRLLAQFKAMPRPYLLSQVAAVMRHRTAPRLRQLADTPTVILQAAHDIVIHPKESRRLHRLIPNSRLVTFHDAGHGLIRHKVDEVNRVLLDHFAASEG